mmetsp:Transcript_138132/g.350032  ORF Transcript_138132/g.350032 Transcript_138132/m.350032 type:complete len:269 (-) Transcript_138132:243-1049(-)
MSSDVHLMGGRGRTMAAPAAGGGKAPRKGSYDAGGSAVFDGYAGQDDWEESWDGAWDGHSWQSQGYYDEYGSYPGAEGGGEWETFEVDLYSMVFSLDDALEPQELYKGLEFDEKSLVITLEAGDVDDQSPAVWRSRPLKIHPEPATVPQRNEKRNSGGNSSAGTPGPDGEAGSATPASGGGATPTVTGSPTRGFQMPAAQAGSAAGGGGGGAGAGGVIRLTEEEGAAVDRLAALGFDRNMAAQAYLACDKNEELAANFLFDSGNDMAD